MTGEQLLYWFAWFVIGVAAGTWLAVFVQRCP
jgi:hypothetical protein